MLKAVNGDKSELMHAVAEISKFASTKRREGVRMLPKNAYISHMKNSENMSSKEALKSWQRDKGDKKVHREKNRKG